MTRPAAFNKIWGYEALQITDENNEKTQEFMRTGWEGGSDKKAPSASVQNYHMQKTDQALQEIERQGCLSWRNDVPYSKGARVFFHGSTFHAQKDNQDVEPQGSRDNGIWYLLPVHVYPTRYDSVEGLGTAAKHNAEDFDAIGSAKTVQEALEALKKALAKIATTGNMADALGTLAIEHGGTGATDAAKARDNLGLKAGATMTKSDANVTQLSGNANEAATTEQLVQLRERCPIGDSTRQLGFVNGDKTRPYMLSSTNEIIELERRAATYGDQYAGRRVYADGYCEQWGRVGYGDISPVPTTVTVTFPITFSTVLGAVGTPDTNQKVTMSRVNLRTNSVLFNMYEFDGANVGGSVVWRAWGYL
ncbi:hypothetical protein [Zymobacter sp. IVIA_5232.4 C2]|uniref:gp53-like domain-containing protein n=1 Tax=Zymobacter sp. IVIA_5232.4 C2 TaxID=3394855 RepID=UPI0039C1EA62